MRKAIKVYVLVTQFIFNMILGGILGAMLGKYLDPEGTSEAIYSGIGLILGLFVSMLLLYQFFRNERLTKVDNEDNRQTD
jgi:uncharacterized membrane protein YfcA